MSDTYISDESVMLDTRIPEQGAVEGLEYGAFVSRSSFGWSGYYVRPIGIERWGVARQTPASDELPDPEDGETRDEAIVRLITEEILNANMIDEFEHVE